MAIAVYFNNERPFKATEVHNVSPDAMLPTKLEPNEAEQYLVAIMLRLGNSSAKHGAVSLCARS